MLLIIRRGIFKSNSQPRVSGPVARLLRKTLGRGRVCCSQEPFFEKAANSKASVSVFERAIVRMTNKRFKRRDLCRIAKVVVRKRVSCKLTILRSSQLECLLPKDLDPVSGDGVSVEETLERFLVCVGRQMRNDHLHETTLYLPYSKSNQNCYFSYT